MDADSNVAPTLLQPVDFLIPHTFPVTRNADGMRRTPVVRWQPLPPTTLQRPHTWLVPFAVC